MRRSLLAWLGAISLAASACSTEPAEETAPAPESSGSLAEQQATYGWGSDRCPDPPGGVEAGYLLGDQLDALTLPDCDDHPVDLRETCGADVLWISVAHAWCPHCRLNGANMEALRTQLSEEGHAVAAVNILIAGNDLGDPPSAELCAGWRAQYEQDRVLTLYDPDDASDVLFEESFTALNVVVDGQRIIQSKLHTDVEEDIESALREALQ